jgi:hypothetical protein
MRRLVAPQNLITVPPWFSRWGLQVSPLRRHRHCYRYRYRRLAMPGPR